jgi:hypothetical protein
MSAPTMKLMSVYAKPIDEAGGFAGRLRTFGKELCMSWFEQPAELITVGDVKGWLRTKWTLDVMQGMPQIRLFMDGLHSEAPDEYTLHDLVEDEVESICFCYCVGDDVYLRSLQEDANKRRHAALAEAPATESLATEEASQAPAQEEDHAPDAVDMMACLEDMDGRRTSAEQTSAETAEATAATEATATATATAEAEVGDKAAAEVCVCRPSLHTRDTCLGHLQPLLRTSGRPYLRTSVPADMRTSGRP